MANEIKPNKNLPFLCSQKGVLGYKIQSITGNEDDDHSVDPPGLHEECLSRGRYKEVDYCSEDPKDSEH